MSYYTLAISSNHDSSICLLEDNKILYMIPSERICREKHTSKITKDVLSTITQYTTTIDLLVIVNAYDNISNVNSQAYRGKLPRINAAEFTERVENLKNTIQEVGLVYKQLIVDNGKHHIYHAAAGFHCSGFEEALCLVVDGLGSSWQWDNASLAETTSLFHITNTNYVEVLYKHLFYRAKNLQGHGWNIDSIKKAQKHFPFKTDISSHLDIGKVYGTTTRHVGFGTSHNAGKLMGLAAYGEPNNLPPVLINGTIISNANVFRNDSQIDTFVHPQFLNMSEKTKQNLAFNVQRALEQIFVARVKQGLELRPSNNLIIGGGCALNILGNSVIKKTFPHLNIYVEPIATDSSQSLGAALFHYKNKFPETRYQRLNNLYLGLEYSTIETKDKLLKLVEQYNNESNLPV